DHIYPLIKKDRYKRPIADSPFDYIRKYDTGLKSRLTIIHAVHVSDEEIDEINEKNIGVVLCPRSNQYLKVGIPPLAKLTELKGLGLATDGLSSNDSLNYFDEMSVFHGLLSDLDNCDPSYQTVYSATLGGARALFIEDTVGSIEKGKKADLIFVSYDKKPVDPYQYIVSSGRDRLEINMVNGKLIYSGNNKFKHLNG
ncbi:MAG: amidohydrolase family protein, partial [Thermodesulfobacteriota bacterium]